MSSVSQRPLAEQIHDVFMSAEPRRKGIHWHLTPATWATRLVFALFAGAGLGGYFYAKANQIYPADIPARILEGAHLGANLITGRKAGSSTPTSTGRTQRRSTDGSRANRYVDAAGGRVGAELSDGEPPSPSPVPDAPDKAAEKRPSKLMRKRKDRKDRDQRIKR